MSRNGGDDGDRRVGGDDRGARRRRVLRSLAGGSAATLFGGVAGGRAAGQATATAGRATATAAGSPPAPTELVWDDATMTTASVEWTPPSSDGVDHLQLYVDGDPVRVVAPDSESFVVSGLTSGTTYEVGIESVGPDGTRSERIATTGSTASPELDVVDSVSMDVAFADSPVETTTADVSIGGPDGQRVTVAGATADTRPCDTYLLLGLRYENDVLKLSPLDASAGSADCLSGLVPTTYEVTVQMNVAPRGASTSYRGGRATTGLPPAPTGLDSSEPAPTVARLSWEPVDDPACTGYAVYVDDEHRFDLGPERSAVSIDGLDPATQPIVGVTARYDDEESLLVHRATPLDNVSGGLGVLEFTWSVSRSEPPVAVDEPGLAVSRGENRQLVTLVGRVAGGGPGATYVPSTVSFGGETLYVTVETREVDPAPSPTGTVPTGYEATIEANDTVSRVHVAHAAADRRTVWTADDWSAPRVNGVDPTDPDGDGFYEDLNGNGRGDVGDAVILYRNGRVLESGAFDFRRDGGVEPLDAVALFRENTP